MIVYPKQHKTDMDKIEKIRQEIKRRIAKRVECVKVEGNHTRAIDGSVTVELMSLLSLLDTLSEEPDKSLEEEISRTYHDGSVTDTEDIDHIAYENIARHFAEWQARQLLQGSPMPEDTVLFNKGVTEGRRLEREDMMKDAEECNLYYDGDFLAIDLNMAELGYSEWDKVRVLVLKAEE